MKMENISKFCHKKQKKKHKTKKLQQHMNFFCVIC